MDANDDYTTHKAIAIAAGAFTLFFLIFGLALAIYPGWQAIGSWADRSETPALIQAVGSIGAIVAAIAVGAWQWCSTKKIFAKQLIEAQLQDVKQRRMRKQMVLTATRYVNFVAKMQIKRLREQKNDKDLLAIAHNLRHLREYGERFPIWSMGNNVLAQRWGGVLESIVNAESALKYQSEDVNKALQSIVDRCRRLTSEFASARDEIITEGEDRGWI